MDFADFYIELKSWQAAIGSVIGFSALMAGALFNAHLNRERDNRLRADEIKAVAAALYGEVVLLRKSLIRMANAVARRHFAHGMGRHRDQPFDRHFREQIALPEPKLYPALADKVGTLPSQMALEIVAFYARLEEAQTWLARLDDDPTRPYSYSVAYVLDPAIDAITGILPTLRLIESMAGLADSEQVGDIKAALDAQDFERIQSEG